MEEKYSGKAFEGSEGHAPINVVHGQQYVVFG
jgi:hypothetical protein